MQYMNEFLTIALVHLVAVASPGPDFAVVVRNSVAYGRRIAMYTSIGIGLAILLHVAYSLVGLSVVIATTPWLFTTFSYAAAAYLLYLAFGALRSGPVKQDQAVNAEKKTSHISAKRAVWMGFLTNGLNPRTSCKIYQVYVVPRLLYGLETLNLQNKDLTALHSFHLSTLKHIQSLPNRTATSAIYLLLGILPINAELHKRQLSLLTLNSNESK